MPLQPTVRRTLWLPLLSTLFATCVIAQRPVPAPAATPPVMETAKAPLPSDPLDRLAELIRRNSLEGKDTSALIPWHLKMTVKLAASNGQPAEDATIEEWWAGPDRARIQYISPSYTASVVRTETGIYRTAGKQPPPYPLEMALEKTVRAGVPPGKLGDFPPEQLETIGIGSPAPPYRGFTSKVEARTVNSGVASLECLSPVITSPPPPLGMRVAPASTSYCSAAGSDTLLFSDDGGLVRVSRQKGGVFQGRYVPTQLVFAANGTALATTSVVQLATVPQVDSSLFEPSGEIKIGVPPSAVPKGGYKFGRKIKGESPEYPKSAKAAHAQGIVKLHGVIGTDGLLHSLFVLSSSAGLQNDLASAALVSAKTFVYTPMTAGGLPVELPTTIIFSFAM